MRLHRDPRRREVAARTLGFTGEGLELVFRSESSSSAPTMRGGAREWTRDTFSSVQGTGAKIWGIVLILAGGTLLALRLSSGQSGIYALMPIALVVLGILRLVRASAQPPREHLFNSQMIGRDGPPDSTPQVAGRPCAHCEVKVASVIDGRICKKCNAVLHAACEDEHATKMHISKDEAPYR